MIPSPVGAMILPPSAGAMISPPPSSLLTTTPTVDLDLDVKVNEVERARHIQRKGIRVYKFNLDYVASIKWVVELPFNARLLSSTRTCRADVEETSATQTERLQLE
ncbi:hypothetical protein Tco_0743571 [Tanacetum coccineum]